MAKILYDTYSVSIKGKSKRDIVKKITQEASEYVFLAKQHMTLSNIPGVSYTDLVIDNTPSTSFIYCSKVDEKQYYLLIYVEGVIVFLGSTPFDEIRSKLLLYQASLVPDIKYYTYDVDAADLFSGNVNALEHDLADSVNQKLYQVESAKAVKLKLTKQYKLIIKVVAAVVIVILLFFLYQKYQTYRAELKAKQQVKKEVSIWQGYYNEVKGPYIDIQLSAIFQQLEAFDLLPNIAINRFEYKNQVLKVTLANFGYSALTLQDWAKQHQYTITKHTPHMVVLQKSIAVKNAPTSYTIMPVRRVKAWLIDQVAEHPKVLSLTVRNNVSKKSNYQVIEGQLAFKKMPITLVNKFIHKLHRYPIRIVSVDGDTTLGSFSGRLKFKIIGG